jgi:hypothetical protein
MNARQVFYPQPWEEWPVDLCAGKIICFVNGPVSVSTFLT